MSPSKLLCFLRAASSSGVFFFGSLFGLLGFGSSTLPSSIANCPNSGSPVLAAALFVITAPRESLIALLLLIFALPLSWCPVSSTEPLVSSMHLKTRYILFRGLAGSWQIDGLEHVHGNLAISTFGLTRLVLRVWFAFLASGSKYLQRIQMDL